MKLDNFPSKRKIVKIVKTFFRKRMTIECKYYGPISLLPLISKMVEKSIHDQK